MSSMKGKRRLPNELLAEMVNAMPAGIIFQEDFMERRLAPLSAFIRPLASKFDAKREATVLAVKLIKSTIISKFEELRQEQNAILTILHHAQVDATDVDWDEFGQRLTAFEQQREELNKQKEGIMTKLNAYDSAWKRSKQFAKELAGEDNKKNGQAINSGGGDGTVCEKGKKRKKPNGEEEATAEEETKMKKAKAY